MHALFSPARTTFTASARGVKGAYGHDTATI